MPAPAFRWKFALLIGSVRGMAMIILAASVLSAGEKPIAHPVKPAELLRNIRQADRIVVLAEGKPYSVGYSSANPKDISELRQAVAVQPPESRFRCACSPELKVKLLRRGAELGVIDIPRKLNNRFFPMVK
jgi:hypothetical protein